MKAEQVIIELANKHPEIYEFMFCIYEPLMYEFEKEIIDKYDFEKELIDGIRPPKTTFWVPRQEIISTTNPSITNPDTGFLSILKKKRLSSAYEVLGITSRVKTIQGRELHLALIDFCCEKPDDNEESNINLEKVVIALTNLGLKKGSILDSGNSYHYVGEEIIPWEHYRKLLQQMQRYSVIGEKWPRYQLAYEFAVLRVLACPEAGKPFEPELVVRFKNNQLSFPFYDAIKENHNI